LTPAKLSGTKMVMNPVLITGANGALGAATARGLTARGCPVLLACRSLELAKRTRDDLIERGAPAPLLDVLALDLADLTSVRSVGRGLPLQGIVCNAGLQIVTGVRHTSAGVEETFAVNHLGHFLLVRELLPCLPPDGRVVFVTSDTHDPERCTGMPAPDLNDLLGLASGKAFANLGVELAGRKRYTSSKLCNVLCAYELQRRLRGTPWAQVDVVAFDPGLMPGTGLARDYGAVSRWAWRYLMPVMTPLLPNVNSVETSAGRLADVVMGRSKGNYVSRGRAQRSSLHSYDEAMARQLWEISAHLTGTTSELA
jgi:NAD(P)-dependent dehydrogenase (short-subunit alcohol dehydrogenase family)